MGFPVVLTPLIPARYISPVIYTHKRVDIAEQGELSVMTQTIHIHYLWQSLWTYMVCPDDLCMTKITGKEYGSLMDQKCIWMGVGGE